MTYEDKAREIGTEHGTAAGTWVVDGNTTTESLRAIMDAVEAGDFFELVDPSAPLSGEWADGYSTRQLSDDLGVDEDSDGFDDLCTAYEDAYYQAFEDEAVRSAKAMLPDEEE